jgi:hypothetical protein
MLIKYGTTRIGLHHNLFTRNGSRLPEVTRAGLDPDTGTTIDIRNNLIWNWDGGYATRIESGATANVVGNLYANPDGGSGDDGQGLMVCGGNNHPSAAALCAAGGGSAYTSGNVSLDGINYDSVGNLGSPLPADPVTTTDACTAAADVVTHAGAVPRDAVDHTYVNYVMAGMDFAACAYVGGKAPSQGFKIPAQSAQQAGGGTPDQGCAANVSLAETMKLIAANRTAQEALYNKRKTIDEREFQRQIALLKQAASDLERQRQRAQQAGC